MNIEKIIKDNVSKLSSSISKVYVSPDIPKKKLDNAIEKIAHGIESNYVLALIDTTLFGSAKEGFIFIGDRIFINHYGKKEYEFKRINKIQKQEHKQKDKEGKEVINNKYILTYDGEEEDITFIISEINQDGFIELIEMILQNIADSDGELETTNQTCPLAMMSQKIQETYLKIICNYAYSDDGKVGSSEYAEIMALIAINSIEKDVRISIRTYMYDNSNIESNEDLIKYLDQNVSAGSLDELRISIIKDIINMFWSKMSNDKEINEWKKSSYIVNIAKEFGVKDSQVEYIVESIKKNKDIIANRQDDIHIKKNMQELAAKAGAVGVPLAAVYLSGSVIGVSAAGMTSGLAALGMGGVLGFSSMFTGIGVAVLLGVGAYKGVKKVTGMGELEKNKQRELMLQEIARNSQRTLNYLIEDVNEISARLQEAIKTGQETEIKIKKISGILSMMTQGAKKTTDQIDFAKREEIICKLPVKIKKDLIEEMASGATNKSIRELIYSAYSAKRMDEQGNITLNCLNTELNLMELENVYNALNGIGFYNMVQNSKAVAMNTAKGLMKGLLR